MGIFGKIVRGVAASAVLASASVGMPVAAGDKVTIGQPAPDFTLTLIDGTKITRDQLHGQVVILNFWATWCVPCRAELPTLDAYYVARKNVGLRVFAVTTEDSLQPYQLKKLFQAMHISPVRKIKGPYDTIGNAVPTNIIIGRDGRIRYAKAAAFDLDDLNAILVPLLREPMPTS
jgi:cytochrome c biogenesis protein CcmG/thiol:disulfide interchange protein DsbE